MTALVDPEELDGKTLVYLPAYAAVDDPLFETSDEEIQTRFLDALFSMYSGLSEDDVIAFRISRVRQVLAVATLNYSANLPPMKTSVPGLYVVNSVHIVNGTLNVNETVKLANDTVDMLMKSADDRKSEDTIAVNATAR